MGRLNITINLIMILIMTIPKSALSGQSTIEGSGGWQANERIIREDERKQHGVLFRESGVPDYKLPDALMTPTGELVTTAEQWKAKVRQATLDAFRFNIYGRAPAVPAGTREEQVSEDPHAIGGSATERRMRVSIPTPAGNVFTFDVEVLIPNGIGHDVPAFLLLNNRPVASADPTRATKTDFWPAEQLLKSGYATAVLHLDDVQPDRPDGLRAGIIAALPVDGPADQHWATIAAWAWGASRALDCLQHVTGIDASRVAVVGHSRGGKTALWAGAVDERFAMVIANDSGRVGAGLSRRRFGETVASVNKAFPHWFCGAFTAYSNNEAAMPVDQHQLLALIAPRSLQIGAADDDLWSDPRGMFLSLSAASNVYALFGDQKIEPSEMPPLEQALTRGPLSFHIRRGPHGLTAEDWQSYLAVADQTWPRR